MPHGIPSFTHAPSFSRRSVERLRYRDTRVEGHRPLGVDRRLVNHQRDALDHDGGVIRQDLIVRIVRRIAPTQVVIPDERGVVADQVAGVAFLRARDVRELRIRAAIIGQEHHEAW